MSAKKAAAPGKKEQISQLEKDWRYQDRIFCLCLIILVVVIFLIRLLVTSMNERGMRTI
jgi:hypothetical protein